MRFTLGSGSVSVFAIACFMFLTPPLPIDPIGRKMFSGKLAISFQPSAFSIFDLGLQISDLGSMHLSFNPKSEIANPQSGEG